MTIIARLSEDKTILSFKETDFSTLTEKDVNKYFDGLKPLISCHTIDFSGTNLLNMPETVRNQLWARLSIFAETNTVIKNISLARLKTRSIEDWHNILSVLIEELPKSIQQINLDDLDLSEVSEDDFEAIIKHCYDNDIGLSLNDTEINWQEVMNLIPAEMTRNIITNAFSINQSIEFDGDRISLYYQSNKGSKRKLKKLAKAESLLEKIKILHEQAQKNPKGASFNTLKALGINLFNMELIYRSKGGSNRKAKELFSDETVASDEQIICNLKVRAIKNPKGASFQTLHELNIIKEIKKSLKKITADNLGDWKLAYLANGGSRRMANKLFNAKHFENDKKGQQIIMKLLKQRIVKHSFGASMATASHLTPKLKVDDSNQLAQEQLIDLKILYRTYGKSKYETWKLFKSNNVNEVISRLVSQSKRDVSQGFYETVSSRVLDDIGHTPLTKSEDQSWHSISALKIQYRHHHGSFFKARQIFNNHSLKEAKVILEERAAQNPKGASSKVLKIMNNR